MNTLFKQHNFIKLKSRKKYLAIVGGGPKALAIATKLKVLGSLGFQVPHLVIFEKESIGHHWKAVSGYTSGELLLGTSPHKDVIFPYCTQFDDKDLNRKVNIALQQYSWSTFLIEMQHYADWIDQGQPAPPHKLWAQYLEWVSEKVKDKTQFIFAEVTHIDILNKKWVISYRNDQGNYTNKLKFDGLVITGPGKSKMPKGYDKEMKNCYDIKDFWENFNNKAFEKYFEANTFKEKFRFAILGTGENSATICKALLDLKAKYPNLDIDIYAPTGLIFSRGEGFWENNVYTNPEKYDWESLSVDIRKALINRTDRGVFSVKMIEMLNSLAFTQLNLIAANVEKIVNLPNGQVSVYFQMNGKCETIEYDMIISSIGNSIAEFFVELLSQTAKQYIKDKIHINDISDVNLEIMMDHSLAVSGLEPFLHIPALSMLIQGPGFGNLSCLGTLADRVVKKYLSFIKTPEFKYEKLIQKKQYFFSQAIATR